MTKSMPVRLLAMLCVLVVLVCAMPAPQVYAETLTEKIKRLKQEIEDIEDNIERLEGSLDSYSAQRDEAARQMALYDELLQANVEHIDQTTAAMEVKQQEIAAKRQDIYENEQLLQERLVAIYKMNTANPITTILSVNSFSELLTVSSNLQVLTQHDTDLLDKLAEERAGLEAALTELDVQLEEFNEQNAEYRNTLANAQATYEWARDNFTWAENEIANQEILAEETFEELEKAQAEEKATQARLSTQGSTSWDGSLWMNGTLTWPVPGFYNVSCEFGSADPNGAAHRGMDVAGGGIAGAAIVAGDDGTVLVAASGHYSYGNYVVIDHGGGMKTLYAHCDSLATYVGATVSRGETIGYVGSTGFSTGYHLHLEVHQDGALQNPRYYLAA